MTTTITRQKQLIISHPKTFTESLSLTKMLTSVMLSEILIDRKLFKNSEFNKNLICGVPVKLIKCKTGPEMKFSFCLRRAMKDLAEKNLQSITLVVSSKEKGIDLEEYSIRFKYEHDDQINIEFLQQEDIFAEFCEAPTDEKKVKNSIIKMLKNEKAFMKTVNPIPDDYFIKLRLTYLEDDNVPQSKYFEWTMVEDSLKESCQKLKLGKIDTKFHSSTFLARSSLIKFDTSEDI